jgi:hypothetical protein
MVHPLPVKDVAYRRITDVDENRRWNVRPTDAAMEECVNWAAQALMNGTASHAQDQTQHMGRVLVSMRWTHRLIRKVLGFDKPRERPMAVDGLSLARLPLEGLFTLCLMIEDPSWVDCYLRDGWKKQYTRFLLQREETRGIARFDSYNESSGPEKLTLLQSILGITHEQRATIDLNELGTPLPPGMKARRIDRFPTPLGVIGALSIGDKRAMLERLYPEYVWLCSFAHGLPDAMFYKTTSDPDTPYKHIMDENELERVFKRRVQEPAYHISLLSIIQAVTEVTTMYPGDVNLRAAVTKAWKDIPDAVLFGQVLWRIRTERVLGVLIR